MGRMENPIESSPSAEEAWRPMEIDGRLAVPAPEVDELTALRAQLICEHLGTDRASVTDPLTPLAALREVCAVCESIEAGRQAPGAGDRSSLKVDASQALASLGTELKSQLQPVLKDYLASELSRLPHLLDDAPGIVRLHIATRSLLDRLRRPARAQAAWRDLVWGASNGIDPQRCRMFALQLREVDEALGHEWQDRERRLRELARAGRFDECEELLSYPPRRSAKVAWFIFSNADISGEYLRVGQVQFFSHRLWPECVVRRDVIERYGSDVEFPAELDDFALEHLSPTDESESHVYARVELSGPRAEPDRNPVAHSRQPQAWARELVSGIVDAGTFRIGGTSWRLLDGVRVYHGPDAEDSRLSWDGTLGFDDPDRFGWRPSPHPLRERTGKALEELPSRFAELLAEGNVGARDALAEVHWFEAAQSQKNLAQRVVLLVRGFELTLPTRHTLRWAAATRHYMRDGWVLNSLATEVFELAWRAEYELGKAPDDLLSSLEQWVVHDGDSFTVTYAPFLRMIGQIAELLPKHSRMRREARALARWINDPAMTASRLDSQASLFDRLLARSVRQRNAVVHGVKTIHEVVATIEPFVSQLAASLAGQAVLSTAEGEKTLASLEHQRANTRRRLWLLHQGKGPVDRVLFGEGEDW
jgi:hypothetical protein